MTVSTDVYDLAVVGAGPAGTAAALRALALRPDLRVVLVDRSPFPRDKTCGDGISPHSVALLDHLGVADVLAGARPFDRISVRSPSGHVVTGATAARGYVLPRSVLDERLVRAATARGATLRHERVTRVQQRDGVAILNGHLAARVVVGADGANSAVRLQMGGNHQPRRSSDGVAVRGYTTLTSVPDELQLRFVASEVWPAYAWCFPGPERVANIGIVAFDGRRTINRDRLAASLADGLPGLDPHPATVRGHRLPLSTSRPLPASGRVLLAGDAAALVNPLSGEGIATALRSGTLAGECAAEHPDAPARAYRLALSRHLRRHLRHTRLASRLYLSPALVDRALRAASHSDQVFRELIDLSVGTGHVSARTLLRMRTTRQPATASR